MRIAVGTKSKPKIEAARRAFERICENEECGMSGVEIVSLEVESGVSDQPMSDKETIEGAVNRAKKALKQSGADLGIGMEGGICEVEGKSFLTGWVAVVDRAGKIGLASGGRMELPEKVIEELKKNERELGEIIDEITGLEGVKHHLGTNGVLTKGVIKRGHAFEIACIEAMARFISPEYFMEQENGFLVAVEVGSRRRRFLDFE